jgi:sec-independent protein translocase protein TatB
MHFGDSIFIFLLALVLFGPKKLPEIGRTIGKLLAEFRRASNEFKFQIQEELRNMEEDERRKKLTEMQAQTSTETTGALEASTTGTTPASITPTILPPSTGAPVSTGAPFATPGTDAEPGVTPSAAEVVVEPAAATAIAAPAIVEAQNTPAHVDPAAQGNGTHASIRDAEAVESDLPSESVHHG